MLVGWESLLNGLHVKQDIVIVKTAVSSDEEESWCAGAKHARADVACGD